MRNVRSWGNSIAGLALASRKMLARFVFTPRLGRSLQIGFVVLALMIANISWYSPGHVNAAGANTYLFWDPASGAIPSGWTLVTTYNGYFPYGETTAATFGALTNVTGRPYTPTVSTNTLGLGNLNAASNGNTINTSTYAHVHPLPVISIGADTSSDLANPDIAAFRSLQLIKYTGVPTTIPQNAIAMFSGTLPASGFTRLSANDNRLIQVNSTVANGGSDTETNTVSVSGINADTNPADATANQNGTLFAAANTHTHTPPSTLSCTTGCAGSTTCTPPGTLNTSGGTGATNIFSCTTTGDIPPYVQPVLGQATSDVPTISVALTAIFDGDPGAGWVVLSNVGGSYYHQYLRPTATLNGASQGSTTRSSAYSTTSGAVFGASVSSKNDGSTAAANYAHTHSIAFSTNTLSNMVPSFNVVIAQKVGFTLNAYRWYVDNAVAPADVTDPWPSGALDIAQDTALPIIPAQYQAPDNGVQLRIRIQIRVNGQPLVANSTSFKLQYQKTTQSDCLTGTWTDVDVGGTGTADWRYGTNSAPNDGSALAATSRLTPASSALETFSKSTSGATTPNGAVSGQTIEYDWLIRNNVALGASDYFIRPVEVISGGAANSGTPLSLYTNVTTLSAECPEVFTKPSTDQQLRHGEFFLTNPAATADPDQGFLWVD